jgi:CheY-like chemotaxis protein
MFEAALKGLGVVGDWTTVPMAQPTSRNRLPTPYGAAQHGNLDAKIVAKLMAKDSGNKQGKRILLVDDDAEIIESLRLALESNGYEVLVARDGNQGLALTERENPDLVILDMMMPKRSGFLVLEKMRRTREAPLRVIMITANEGSRHKAYAEMLGVDDYIRKPFPMDRLIDSVQRLLG